MNPNRTEQQQRRPQTATERPDHSCAAGRAVPWWVRAGVTAVTLIVVAIGGLCLYNGARRIGHPFPGFLMLENRIVLSIARPQWSLEKTARIFFAQVVGVGDRPVGNALEIQDYVAALPPGTLVTYRLRKQAEVFREAIPARLFTRADYVVVYGTYFVVGSCFALAGLWVMWRRQALFPAAVAFFTFCQSAALVLLTGGDLYGPHWFTSLYFAAFGLTPAALLHLASSFPEPIGYRSRWRRVFVLLLYAGAMGVGITFHLIKDEPSLFLPLLYTGYLLVANVLLLYLARLLSGWWTRAVDPLRPSLARALAGLLLSGLVAGAIFATYPALDRPVPPLILVVPLAIFPLLTASALHRAAHVSLSPSHLSVRLRLSLLFLGAVETAFLAGMAVFWLNISRDWLLDDLRLNERQQAHLERVRDSSAQAAADLAAVEALVQTVDEYDRVAAARMASVRADPDGPRQAIEQLIDHYRRIEARLDSRRSWINRFAAGLVLALVASGIAQSVAFIAAIRRWLIRPIDLLATATNVIATGDLSHRVDLPSTDEFAELGGSINAMAKSLDDIQRQVDSIQEARQHAAGEARDAERRRLARELHDSVLQDLAAVKLHVEIECKRDRATLQPVVEQLLQIITDVHRVVDDLRPPDLLQVPLAEAIVAHAEVITRAHGIASQLDLDSTLDIAEWARRDVYRIAQEAMANAVPHGAPKRLVIRLTRDAECVVLEITDDGAGFDPPAAVLGSGIVGMRERAAVLGADLQILSAPSRGASVRLKLPPALAR